MAAEAELVEDSVLVVVLGAVPVLVEDLVEVVVAVLEVVGV